MMIEAKQKLYFHCVDFLNRRIETAREAIRMAQESANDETKSSAGDKYETGRAMMQLEVEQNNAQLLDALKQKETLEAINIQQQSQTAQTGSLVVTDRQLFFIAISMGLQQVDDKQYAIVSNSTPIGKKLIGLRVNDMFEFGDKKFKVLQIL